MKPPTRVWALAASLLITGSLAACSSNSASTSTSTSGSSDGSPAPSASATASSSSPAASMSASSTPSDQAATVKTAKSDLGTILVDGSGMTLYLYTKDTQGSGVSTCEGECLGAWPPLLGTPTAGKGADTSLLATLKRTDGTTQVTYNGWPLYTWTQDKAPGDTTGQGVSNAWWVLSAAGDPIDSK